MKNLLLLTTVLTTLLAGISAAHADRLDKSSPKISHGMYRDRGKSSPKIAEGMRSDVAGHLMIEASGIRKSPTPTRGVYRDRGKSSPKIAEGMRTDVLGHLMIEASGIRKSPAPTRGRLEHGPGLRR